MFGKTKTSPSDIPELVLYALLIRKACLILDTLHPYFTHPRSGYTRKKIFFLIGRLAYVFPHQWRIIRLLRSSDRVCIRLLV